MTTLKKTIQEIRQSEAANQKYLTNLRLATINMGSLVGHAAEW